MAEPNTEPKSLFQTSWWGTLVISPTCDSTFRKRRSDF